jgi:hypothetical protein
MENEFMKRGYLLPYGCKDLIDVLKPKGPKHSPEASKITAAMMEKHYAEIEDILAALPPNKEEFMIPAQISALQLGNMLTEESFDMAKKSGEEPSWTGMISYKPYAPLVFRDLRKMGFSKATDLLDFETVSKVLAKYGVTCKLADE